MGATRVIAVDLNVVPTSLLDTAQPNMLEIIGVSANIIEAGLTQKRLAEDTPDILIQPDLAHISYLDCSKGEGLIQMGYEAVIRSFDTGSFKVKS